MFDSIKTKWVGEDDGEVWVVKIGPDCFTPGSPMVVVLDTKQHDGTDDFSTLITVTPEQAREIAAALVFFADYVQDANDERQAVPKDIGRVATRPSEMGHFYDEATCLPAVRLQPNAIPELERLKEKAAGAEMWRDQSRGLVAEVERLRERNAWLEGEVRRLASLVDGGDHVQRENERP